MDSKPLKVCARCKEPKSAIPGQAFYPRGCYSDGLDPWCKQCRCEYDKERRQRVYHRKYEDIFAGLISFELLLHETKCKCPKCGKQHISETDYTGSKVVDVPWYCDECRTRIKLSGYLNLDNYDVILPEPRPVLS